VTQRQMQALCGRRQAGQRGRLVLSEFTIKKELSALSG
jgi:mRNA-degrading endonuclease toxin of MazEF toxin-antitoxin module